MIIGIDHGYYAIKTPHVCFPTGTHPDTNTSPIPCRMSCSTMGEYYVCGTGRQTLVRSKTANDNYYLLTLAALAQEIRKRKGERNSESCSCSRASPYRVWKGKTEIQGVSVSEGTANPFLI